MQDWCTILVGLVESGVDIIEKTVTAGHGSTQLDQLILEVEYIPNVDSVFSSFRDDGPAIEFLTDRIILVVLDVKPVLAQKTRVMFEVHSHCA